MEESRHGGRRRKRARARSFLGAAAISASLTPACAFLTHQHHPCHGPARPPQRTTTPEKAWDISRGNNSSLRRVRHLPAHTEEKIDPRFKPLKRPPLIRSTPRRGSRSSGSDKPETAESGGGLGGGSADVPGLDLTYQSKPSVYQVQLFRSIVECERNSLAYLPSGLADKAVVASMVLRRLLELNPGRQAFFLVETTALAAQQVRALIL